MSRHGLMAVTLLAIWLLLGPIAMAFDGCMGCELPCAQPACAVTSPMLSIAPDAVISAIIQVELHPVAAIPSTPEHPPKPLRFAA
jgi:hypothetical protein